jgi:Yip1 domain
MNPEVRYASPNDKIEPEPTPQSFFNRLIGVYFSPGETFQEIGRAPRLLLPLIALVLVTSVASYIVLSRIPEEVSMRIIEQQVQQQVDSGRINQEQANQQKERMIKGMTFFRGVAPFFAAVFSIVMALFFAGLVKLASLIFGGENNFKPLFTVALYSILAVSILSSILFIILVFIKPADEFDWENPIPSNLAAFLSVAGIAGLPKFLKTFLSYVDVFYIWRLILLAIGFAAVSKKLKTSTALTWLVVVALLIALVHSSWMAAFG